jgi:hypothetical protein
VLAFVQNRKVDRVIFACWIEGMKGIKRIEGIKDGHPYGPVLIRKIYNNLNIYADKLFKHLVDNVSTPKIYLP